MLIAKTLPATNPWLRWAVRLGLIALVCIQCTGAQEAFRETDLLSSPNGIQAVTASAPAAQQIAALARTDQLALLKLCLANYDRNVQDYTCTFIKRERLNGKTGKGQEIEVKFRDKPFSVAMHWVRNAPMGDSCLYVEGANEGNMLIGLKGWLSLAGTMKRKPDCPDVLANTLRPINLFGFRQALASLINVYELAASRGELMTEFQGYRQVAGRETIVLQRILPQQDGYPAAKTVIYIDTELLVPLCIEAWDWDGNFESRYIYKDVKLNVGLTQADFVPAKNGL
ncbi:MAG: DUF1571 domain-containing protein [Planctomycetes bacterium]|nr:DUF1571 domain-containing protein [Planctomycetota bacterium]